MLSQKALFLLLFVPFVAAVNTLVDLGYAKYQGATASKDTNVNYWWGLRYAAPPVGPLRFQAPLKPVNQTTVQSAKSKGAVCLGYPGPSTADKSEDCLFLDIEAPKNATFTSKLPVYFYIQGGGFKQQGAAMSPVNLIAASNYSMVVVQLTYRIGPYGFLGGKEILANGSANNGLKDQRRALRWVKDYISYFGGDPKHVVLGGASAGGQSVKMQLLAYNATNENLFQAALIESGASSTIYTVEESQFEFDKLANRTGCNQAAGGAFACLRDLNVTTLQNSTNSQPIALPGRSGLPVYTYNPMIDKDFLVDYPTKMFDKGQYVRVPLLVGDDENEGTIFTPKTLASYNDTNAFVGDTFPFITPDQFTRINTYWNYSDFNQNWTLSPGSSAKPYWRQASTVYGDIRYTCPGIYLAEQFKNVSQPVWMYLYNTTTSTDDMNGYGCQHTSELTTIWNNSATLDSNLKAQVPLMQAYWTSFVLRYDPNPTNPNTTTNVTIPKWTQYNSTIRSRMVLQTGSNGIAPIKQNVLDRCAYWKNISSSIRQ
ncbi:hypothetical protein FH972_021006 [Carpinus fangiana]|uniref:Carboxylic ester hydrolase n=1 Tax=Carpinus fangiana TaxID=176857 RepID=A0A5N6KNG2_9ROSI|nr:hypothetical protein FH972_021006 [Carpinus fangiana]